jgi:hypothetical protein
VFFTRESLKKAKRLTRSVGTFKAFNLEAKEAKFSIYVEYLREEIKVIVSKFYICEVVWGGGGGVVFKN